MNRKMRVLSLLLAAVMALGLLPAQAFAAGDVAINAANFPDEVFRKYVSDEFDKDKNGSLSAEEIASVTSVYVWGQNISTLKGVELLTSLIFLECGANQLVELDTSRNTDLTYLYCEHNQLNRLDLTSNRALIALNCNDNKIENLNLSTNSLLTSIKCEGNQIKKLDVSNNAIIEEIDCSHNRLVDLNVRTNIILSRLDCGNNQLGELDVSQNKALEELDCSYNNLAIVDVSVNENLERLSCSHNRISILEIDGAPIVNLSCGNNQLITLDISNNHTLKQTYENGVIDRNPNIAGSHGDWVVYSYNYGSSNPARMIIDSKTKLVTTSKSVYTVTFYANGGAVSVASHATGTDGKLASLPTPTRSNYTFDGWFDANGNRVTLDTVYTGDTTLTARWTENTGGGTGGGSIGGGSSSGSVSSRNGVSIPSSIPNGKVTSDAKNAKAGDTVTLTVAPDEGFELKSLSVTDKKGNKIDLKDNGDGTYTFTLPNSKVTVEPEFVKKQDAPVTPPAPVEPERTYDDVKPDAWYNDAVEYVTENGLMNGTAAKAFEPARTLSRAMVATVLHRMEETPDPKGVNDFIDVSENAWHTDAVIWASANGVVNGYGEGRFGPMDDITREQLAVMLYRYAKLKGYDTSKSADLSAYTDADTVSTWAKEAMAWANAEGLITGRTATTLAPKGTATRAEAAAILMRFCENVK